MKKKERNQTYGMRDSVPFLFSQFDMTPLCPAVNTQCFTRRRVAKTEKNEKTMKREATGFYSFSPSLDRGT